eukprot:TRINITY_DN810_c0_g1_i2.p1 TRINITY_DN810_c0_g1~~TRINITY_DN810_c0_g1_i2.p1  ORF type:complete len:108 (-),score=33.88 TRINITY_DN810_c0_g1_i2:91-414(-)
MCIRDSACPICDKASAYTKQCDITHGRFRYTRTVDCIGNPFLEDPPTQLLEDGPLSYLSTETCEVVCPAGTEKVDGKCNNCTAGKSSGGGPETVSYTHLTLPTIYSV